MTSSSFRGMPRSMRTAVACVALSCVACRPAAAQGMREGDAAFRTGKYNEAIAIFGRLADDQSATPGARRALVRALSEVGRYRDAIEAGRKYAAADTRSSETWNALGEALYTTGAIDEAEADFKKAIAGGASDSLTAQVNLAIARLDRGDRAAATAIFDHVVDAYTQRRGRLTSSELTAVGTACRYLGASNPQLFKDALKAYDLAIAADSGNLEPRVRLGELFLEKYNSPDARATFRDALRLNPSQPRALLGAARQITFDGGAGAIDLVKKSLGVNPNLPEAHVLLATLLLDSEDYAEAATEIDRALATDSTSLDALSVLAAIRELRGDQRGFDAAKRRALARNPGYADLYNTAAELAARNRLYRQAVDLARQATELDPRSWRAFGLLGINQLRTGAVADARKNLEIAFKGDPYNVWNKNTLDLLDSFKDYKETKTEHFQFVIDGKESELLSIYFADLAEEAYGKLAARYNYTPPTPVRVEVFRSHADFSVRTVGLAGLGALGVSFGSTLAMDSPAAREAGAFNWGSVFWHELTHAFTLGMTDHRVPRWLSEGLSVYEERRARPSWGADVNPAFLAAYKAGKLVPVSRMNDGFMRPSYPEQVLFSYYEASLVCELIERDHGPRAINDMLAGYKAGLTTEQVFQRVLKTDLASFDAKFDAYVKQRFAGPLAAVRAAQKELPSAGQLAERVSDPGDWAAQLAQGRALMSAAKEAEAVAYLERARALFPEYAGGDSPYWYLAQIHKARGELRPAADELTKLTSINEDAYAANVQLADLLQQLGDTAGAASALDRAMYISPYDPALHARLAGLFTRVGDRTRAIRERRAVLALEPVDRAEALYQLALAYYEGGDLASARREVLRALEGAPDFERAQALLLTIRRGGAQPATPGRPR